MFLSLFYKLNHRFLVAELRSNFKYSPNGSPISGDPRGRSSHFPETSSPARPHYSRFPVRSPPSAEYSLRVRSRSRPINRSSIGRSRIKNEGLTSAWLIPLKNSTRRFETRRYTFPRDAPIHVRRRYCVSSLMPTGGLSVISTSSGDDFAIFKRNNILQRGVYK